MTIATIDQQRRSRKSTIQLQLTIEVNSGRLVQTRKLRRAGRPVVADHQLSHLGMHLKLPQPAPSGLTSLS